MIIQDQSFRKLGDIAVWDETYGEGFGHVAIVYTNITSNDFESFDQNWTVREGQLVTHTYSHLLGYLRFKNTPPVPPTPVDIIKTKFKWVLYANKIRRRNNERKRF